VRNIKLTLQYDGTNFYGFELQPNKRTIRREIEKALNKIFKTRIKIISSSRTDSGVHALALVCNFKTKSDLPASKISKALNGCLPKEIRAVKAEDKDKVFHARYDAKSKVYEYLIYNGKTLPPFIRNITWHVKPKLDLPSMRKAARILKGKHDFSSFCAARSDDKDFVRIIHSLGIRHSALGIWRGAKVRVISITVRGNGFLYKMVRNMVGTLVEVGLGRFDLADVKRILKGRNRKLAGRCAPAQGLCLVRINYR